jgi:hypothetical protein
MCDDSVVNKHIIREFDKLLTSQVENNRNTEEFVVVRIDPNKSLQLVDLKVAFEEVGGNRETAKAIARIEAGRLRSISC